jgi:LEA14-like dessication related protein
MQACRLSVKNRIVLSLIAAAIIISATALSVHWYIAIKKAEIEDCEIFIRNVQIVGFDIPSGKIFPSAMRLGITLDIYNPNDVNIKLYNLEYEVYTNEIYVGNGSLDEEGVVDIPKAATRMVNISYIANLTVLPEAALKTIQDIFQGESIHWMIKGTAYIKTPLGKSHFEFSRRYIPFEQ